MALRPTTGCRYRQHRVKDQLYSDSVNVHRFFPRDPETARMEYRGIGVVVVVIRGVGLGILGAVFAGGLVAIPIIAGGMALFLLAPAMSRLTARGWEMYRRCLGPHC